MDTDASEPPSPVTKVSGAPGRATHTRKLGRLVFASVLDLLSKQAHRRWYPVLVGALAFFATLSMSVPVVPLLSASVLLNARRWKAIAACAAFGSGAGALILYVSSTISLGAVARVST